MSYRLSWLWIEGCIDSAHGEALAALTDAINDATLQGQSDQHFAVDVRDDLGLIFEITAVMGSKILRKQ